MTKCQSSQQRTVELSRRGTYFRLTAPGTMPTSAGGKKGRKITHFSRRARGRIFQRMGQIKKAAWRRCLFLTLTYPGEYEHEPAKWKRHLDRFGKEWLKAYPSAALVWKMEPQPDRGAPHFHLLCFGISYVPYDWIRATWYAAVGSGDERHARRGMQCEKIRNAVKGMKYVGKYVAKSVDLDDGDWRHADDWEHPGRWWGIIGRKNLPTEVLTIPVDMWTFYKLKRVMRKYMEHRRKPWVFRGRGGGWALVNGAQTYKLVNLMASP